MGIFDLGDSQAFCLGDLRLASLGLVQDGFRTYLFVEALLYESSEFFSRFSAAQRFVAGVGDALGEFGGAGRG
jgi:hypothetical protein